MSSGDAATNGRGAGGRGGRGVAGGRGVRGGRGSAASSTVVRVQKTREEIIQEKVLALEAEMVQHEAVLKRQKLAIRSLRKLIEEPAVSQDSVAGRTATTATKAAASAASAESAAYAWAGRGAPRYTSAKANEAFIAQHGVVPALPPARPPARPSPPPPGPETIDISDDEGLDPSAEVACVGKGKATVARKPRTSAAPARARAQAPAPAPAPALAPAPASASSASSRPSARPGVQVQVTPAQARTQAQVQVRALVQHHVKSKAQSQFQAGSTKKRAALLFAQAYVRSLPAFAGHIIWRPRGSSGMQSSGREQEQLQGQWPEQEQWQEQGQGQGAVAVRVSSGSQAKAGFV
ncbi:hypothetical protein B484DRAFT_43495, partial [Ochromonadaceae sp. CCMP2298]